ncbi:hypothetical protein V8F33_003756 [Rhypophila sp. PSN 637]
MLGTLSSGYQPVSPVSVENFADFSQRSNSAGHPSPEISTSYPTTPSPGPHQNQHHGAQGQHPYHSPKYLVPGHINPGQNSHLTPQHMTVPPGGSDASLGSEIKNRNKKSKLNKAKKETWLWEILAMTGALLCEAAIVIILARTQDRPLDSAWRFYFSINTMISTLTAVGKSFMLFGVSSCLGQLKWVYFLPSSSQGLRLKKRLKTGTATGIIGAPPTGLSGHEKGTGLTLTRGKGKPLAHFGYFDEAAKGPLGALRILLTGVTHLLGWGAYIGAFIVLLSLAIDPFAQQVVSFHVREVIVPATQLRLDAQQPNSSAPLDEQTLISSSTAVPPPSFGYTHNYTYGAQQDTQQTRPDEESGYPWIFADSVDLGMLSAMTAGLYGISTPPAFNCSSKCRWDGDNTISTVISRPGEDLNASPPKASYISLGFESTCQNVTLDTMRTEKCSGKTGLSLSNHLQCNMTTPGEIKLQTSVGIETGYTPLVVDTKRLDYNVVRGYSGSSPGNGPKDGGPVSPKFLRVAVLSVADVYLIQEPDGHLIGHTVTECELGLAAWKYSHISATGSNFTFGTTEKISLQNGTYLAYDSNSTGKNYYEIRFDTEDVPGGLFIRDTDLGMLADFLSREPFTGSIGTSWSRYQWGPGIRSGLLGGNVPAVFDNMARAMTDYIRSGPGSSLAYGSRVDSVVFVQVDWLWLILPVVSVVAATGLLGFTVLVSGIRRSKGGKKLSLWKDKILPVLFTFYDERDGGLRTLMDGPEEVGAYAASVKAVLR